VVNDTPVLELLAVTVAPTTTPPELSVTRPEIDPLEIAFCPAATCEKQKAKRTGKEQQKQQQPNQWLLTSENTPFSLDQFMEAVYHTPLA
jgi:hypothetical protein